MEHGNHQALKYYVLLVIVKNGLSVEKKTFRHLVKRLDVQLYSKDDFMIWFPHLEGDWLEGCSGQGDNSFDDHDDKSFSIQDCINDGEQDLQDTCMLTGR